MQPLPTGEPVWPTVMLPDGRAVKLGPNGEQIPVTDHP